MSTVNTRTFTYELTNDAVTLTEGMGVKAISIFCNTATAGTVQGTEKLGALSSSALTVAENETITFASQTNGVVFGLIITAPAGCTLQIIAQL